MFVEKTAQNIKLNIIFIKVFQSDFRSFHSTVICIVLLSLTPYACMGKSVPRPMHICLINVVLDLCPSSLPPQFVSSLIPCAVHAQEGSYWLCAWTVVGVCMYVKSGMYDFHFCVWPCGNQG